MRWRRATSTVAIVVALVVGHEVTSRTESGESPPFFTAGSVGHPARLVYADVEVTDVRPAHYLAPQFDDQLATMASGVYVVVVATLTATRQPTSFIANWLVDDEGRAYFSSQRAGCSEGAVSVKTGVPTYAVYCYDVPAARLAGLHWQISRGNPFFGSTKSDAMADVDLGISESDAKAWADTTDVYLAETYAEKPIELQTVTLDEQGDS